jgi:hypothetical protein
VISGPWREVVYIRTLTGDHGAPFWVLTASCGHTSSRTQRVPRPSDIVLGGLRPDRYCAPKRVRCLSCALGSPPIPVVFPEEAIGHG